MSKRLKIPAAKGVIVFALNYVSVGILWVVAQPRYILSLRFCVRLCEYYFVPLLLYMILE